MFHIPLIGYEPTLDFRRMLERMIGAQRTILTQ
jgi:hypothetical protein